MVGSVAGIGVIEFRVYGSSASFCDAFVVAVAEGEESLIPAMDAYAANEGFPHVGETKSASTVRMYLRDCEDAAKNGEAWSIVGIIGKG